MGVPERIREIRKANGKTVEEFAKNLGVTKGAMSNLENGKRSLTGQMLSAICSKYNVSMEWLRDGTGSMEPPRTMGEQLSDFFGDVLQDPNESGRKRLVAALAKLPPERWEQMADLIEAIAAGMK